MLQFEDFIRPRGYSFLLAALYLVIALLLVAVALSSWVAWCFQHRNFPFVWPIKLLRVYANIFFHVLDVATLTLLQLPFDCRWLGYSKDLRNHLSIFPSMVCTAMPHVAHMTAAGVALTAYLSMAALNLMADFELNPTTRNLYATANSAVEVRAFFIKSLMTMTTYAIGWPRIQNLLLLGFTAYLTWMYLKWQPHLFGWVNHLRVGLNAAITVVSLGAVVLSFHKQPTREFRVHVTNTFFAMTGPVMIAGSALSYVRLTWWTKYVLMRYRTAPARQKARRIYKFKDAREVEIVARVCRRWTDAHFEVLDRGAAKEAEIVIKGGMQLFPNSATMILTYVNFLVDVLESTQTGYSQLQAAKKCTPNLMERFAIFAREQEHMQRATGAKSGESSVDLVSYVEYQRNHRMVMRAHRAALVAIRNFWQLLLHNSVSFTSLAKALHRIEKCVNVAEGFYRTALARYPASPKLLRGYGKFLEAVKNNPWKAAKYFSEAEKLQELQQQDEATLAVMGPEEGGVGGLGGGAHLLHRVDERVNIVFLINSAGIIQLANKNACSLLGYGKGELDGKNINTIMPPPFSQRHNRYIRQYIQTGRERVISSVNTVVALHKARYVLPVKLAVSKVSGATEDSIFMGVLETVPVDPAEAHLYLLPSGVVTAMDQAFAEWLGFELGDIIGKDIGTLVTDAEQIKNLLPKFDPLTWAKLQRVSTLAPGLAAATAATLTPGTTTSGTLHTGLTTGLTTVPASPPLPSTGLGGTTTTTTHVPGGMFHGLHMGGLHMPALSMHLPSPNNNYNTLAPGASPSMTAVQSLATPEHLTSVHFLHKYTRPVECSVTMQRLGVGPVECMVELTLRRNGPAHLLALTGPSGRVRYIASELARALGTSPSALYRQPLGDIMPQPWGTLHAAWIKTMGGASAAAPGVIVPGSCRSGITTVLGSSLRMQGYYRLAISSNDDSGEMRHVIEAEPSSREAAMAERRLVLTVDADGMVTEVDDGPTWLYGFPPAQLLGRSLADVVTTLRPQPGRRKKGAESGEGGGAGKEEEQQQAGEQEEEEDDVSVTDLLSMLISKAMMQNGVSWRVGVTVPTDEEELRALGPMRQAVMAKRTTPAVMEIEVSLDTTALGRGAPTGTGMCSCGEEGTEDGEKGGLGWGAGSAGQHGSTGGSGISTTAAPQGAGDGGGGCGGGGGGGDAGYNPELLNSATSATPGGAATGSSSSLFWRTGRLSSANGAPPLSPGSAAAMTAALMSSGGGGGGGGGTEARLLRRSGSVPTIPARKSSGLAGLSSDPTGSPTAVAAAEAAAALGGGLPPPNPPAARRSSLPRVRRKSWIAMEGPGGGIVVVSGAAVEDAANGGVGGSRRTRRRSSMPAVLGRASLAAATACANVEVETGESRSEATLAGGMAEEGGGAAPAAGCLSTALPQRPSGSKTRISFDVKEKHCDDDDGDREEHLRRMHQIRTPSPLSSGSRGNTWTMPTEDGTAAPCGAVDTTTDDDDGGEVGTAADCAADEPQLIPGHPVGDGDDGADSDGAIGHSAAGDAATAAVSRQSSSSLYGFQTDGGGCSEDPSKMLLTKLLSARFTRVAAGGPLDTGLSTGQEDLLGPLLPLLMTSNNSVLDDLPKTSQSGMISPARKGATAATASPVSPGPDTRDIAAAAAMGTGETGVGEDIGGDEVGDDDSVELPLSIADDARVVVIRVSLWRADFLSPVVEVDSSGTIAAMVGDDLSPPGLLFGVPTPSMLSQSLHSFLQLPDRSVSGLFHDPGTARRGGLKTTAKEANKVGSLREITARHFDGQPLDLTLQAVVKDSSPTRTYVVLKPRKPSKGSRAALLSSVADVGLRPVLAQAQAQAQAGLPLSSVPSSLSQPPSDPEQLQVQQLQRQWGSNPQLQLQLPQPEQGQQVPQGQRQSSGSGYMAIYRISNFLGNEPYHLTGALSGVPALQGDLAGLGAAATAGISGGRVSGSGSIGGHLRPSTAPASVVRNRAALRYSMESGASVAAPVVAPVLQQEQEQQPYRPYTAPSAPSPRMNNEGDADDPRVAQQALLSLRHPSVSMQHFGRQHTHGQPGPGTGMETAAVRPGPLLAFQPQSGNGDAETSHRGEEHPFGVSYRPVESGPTAPGARLSASGAAAGGGVVGGGDANSLWVRTTAGPSAGRGSILSVRAGSRTASVTPAAPPPLPLPPQSTHGDGGAADIASRVDAAATDVDSSPLASAMLPYDGDSTDRVTPPISPTEVSAGSGSSGATSRTGAASEVRRRRRRGLHSGSGSDSDGGGGARSEVDGDAVPGHHEGRDRRAGGGFGLGRVPSPSRKGRGAEGAAGRVRPGSAGKQHAAAGGGEEAAEDEGGLDLADDASDNASGSVVSEVLDASGPTADYRRGKRYRKLLKVLESPVVQRAAHDFQWQALLANVAQLLTNLTAFVLLTVLLKQQSGHVQRLHAATGVNRLMHEAFIIMQKLNNHYEGLYPAAGYYSAASVPPLTEDLKLHLDVFAELNTQIYSDVGNERPDPNTPYDPRNAQDIWNKPVHNETLFYSTTPYRIEYRNTSLWDLSSSFIERASEVQHMHATWGPAHATLADFDAYRWVMTNGLGPLHEGYSDALLQLMNKAISQAHSVNRLQLVLLVIQGCVVCSLLVGYMWWLQRRVSQQRYRLYSLFMLVPVGLLRALASKSVAVTDNSDGEASSDDEHHDAHVGGPTGHQGDAQGGRSHSSSVINLAMKSSLWGGGAGRSSEAEGTGSLGKWLGWIGRRDPANPALAPNPSSGSASRLLRPPSANGGHNPNGGPGAGSSGGHHKRRQLVPSNYDSVSLLAPFVVWGALICVLYAVGFVLLQNTAGPLALLSTHNVAVVRMHRLMLYSLQVGSQADEAGRRLLQPVLAQELRDFEREWDVLMYGANTTLRQERHFEMCTTNTAFSDGHLSYEAFRIDGCLTEQLSEGDLSVCRNQSDKDYAATVHGVSMMIERFKEDVSYLVRLPPALISLNSSHLDYIMREGETNVENGINTVAGSLISNIDSLYHHVSLLQIFSLVISWLLAVAFIFVQLRPFLRSNHAETQRIARMLSELPPDVDIEGIVARVLLRPEAASGGGGGGGGAPVQRSSGSAGAGGEGGTSGRLSAALREMVSAGSKRWAHGPRLSG
ncbi:hypothetical protein Agub_g2042 [Astrephomene gubernaculifera]|uniref:PAS domain-containing protein n=1 Tax=Astrephomene gubernaculifera TaxID=47775 RepID=A0AAD3HHC4_9CHLO|nr:hypothetical protein Agub_g2042 [Astrephomene gubernaculifera]